MSLQVSAVKSVEQGAVQDFVEHIIFLAEEATLCYALVTMMDENNLGYGPIMKHRGVNLYDISKDFMDEVVAGMNCHGLQKTLLANVVATSIHKEDINLNSLLPTQSTLFMNHVEWQPGATKSKLILYNGNHHLHYTCN